MRLTGLLSLTALGVAAVTLFAPPLAAAGPSEVRAKLEAAAAPEEQLHQVETTSSLGARFVRFHQEVDGVSVLGSEAVVSDLPGPRAVLIDDSRRGVDSPGRASVSKAAAVDTARARGRVERLRAPARARLAIVPDRDGGRLVWRVLLPSWEPQASFEVLVDAQTGEAIRVRDLLVAATGSARIFDPNPLVEQGSRTGLANTNGGVEDGDSPLLTDLRRDVTLRRLDDDPTGCLAGAWVRVTLPIWKRAAPADDVCQPDRDWSSVSRSDDRFEALMAYFHIDRAQEHIRGLGFRRETGNGVNARQQRVHANDFADDNSYYDPSTGAIALGTGGVDDGEDAEVIAHEYGHAVQEAQVPGFGDLPQGRAMGEGFGDYLASALAAANTPSATFDACFAEWDTLGSGSTASVPCLRRVDRDLTAAQVGPGTACNGRYHCAGEAWSGVLWDIRARLGGPATDRLVIQSHFSLTSTADFHDGSTALLVADRTLYGGANQAFLRSLLSDRGLLDLERLDGSDTDADGRPDGRDNCPGVANPPQSDWNRNGRGDACDSRARVTLDHLRIRHGMVTLEGRVEPASLLRPRHWRILVERRVCARSRCRWQAFARAVGERRLRRGRIGTSVRLPRPGRYRFHAVLVHRRLEAPRSTYRTLSVR